MTYFFGFCGSSGPSQLTIRTSESDCELASCSLDSFVVLSSWGVMSAFTPPPRGSTGLATPGSSRMVGVVDSETCVAEVILLVCCARERRRGRVYEGHHGRRERLRCRSWESALSASGLAKWVARISRWPVWASRTCRCHHPSADVPEEAIPRLFMAGCPAARVSCRRFGSATVHTLIWRRSRLVTPPSSFRPTAISGTERTYIGLASPIDFIDLYMKPTWTNIIAFRALVYRRYETADLRHCFRTHAQAIGS